MNIKYFMKHSGKQSLAFFLALAIFAETSHSAFAAMPEVVDALETPTSSNINNNFTTLNVVNIGDFNPDTYGGAPFYFDENGNRVYDEDYSRYEGYIKPEYYDIAYTFEDYPETTMDICEGDIAPYIAVETVSLGILAVALASCGVYIAGSALSDFASNHFEPWVRRTYGADSSRMNTLQNWLTVQAGTAFVGMRMLRDMVGNFLDSAKWNGNSATYNSAASVEFKDSPFQWCRYPGRFLKSAIYMESDTLYYYYDLWNTSDVTIPAKYALFADVDESDGFVENPYLVWGVEETSHGLRCSYDSINYDYKYYYADKGYFGSSISTGGSFGNSVRIPLSVVSGLGTVFSSKQAAMSHLAYGTSGGIISSSTAAVVPQTITFKKTWSGLRENYKSAYNPSDTIDVPESFMLDSLLNKVYASDTEYELISVLDPVWKQNKNFSLSSAKSYSILSYIVSALATYAGITLTSDLVDEFINSFYGGYVDGTSAKKEDQSKEIVNNFVVIEGGGNNGDPDDNNDNNKYTVGLKLAVALGSFLVTKELIESPPDFSSKPNISNNIKVDAPSSSGGGSTKPGGDSGGSTSNPETSGLLKNVLDTITSILDSVQDIPDIFSILQSLSTTIKDSIVDGIKEIPFFNSALSFLENILSNIQNISNWDVGTLINAISNRLNESSTYLKSLSDNVTGIASWDLPDQLISGLNLPTHFSDLLNVIENLPGKIVYGFINSDIFSGIYTRIGALPQALADLLPDSISSVLGINSEFSLANSLNSIFDSITSVPGKIGEILKNGSGSSDGDNENPDDSGFHNFLNLFMITLLIIILLIILFINCLRFIVLVFNIPASTTLLPADMLTGIEYLKGLQLPLFGVSLYALLLSCAYFVIFMTVIMTLRRKIDKIHF